MVKAQETNPIVVKLTDKISVTTMINPENHAALRAGFVGYPSNPRWNVTKYKAWKTGVHWREALLKGEMIVRNDDSMLIWIKDQRENIPITESPKQKLPITESPKFDFTVFAKQLLSYSRSKTHSTV